MVGTGRAANAGVLIKYAEALEIMEKVGTLVVDKTGTLTEKKRRLVGVAPADGFDRDEVPRLGASLERVSEHPLAAAIVAGAASEGIELSEVSESQSVTGKGVVGIVDGRAVTIGNLRHLEATAIDPGPLSQGAELLRGQGRAVMLVALDGRPAGLISSPIRSRSRRLHHFRLQNVGHADRRRRALSVLRAAALAHRRCRGDELERRVRRDERAQAQSGAPGKDSRENRRCGT